MFSLDLMTSFLPPPTPLPLQKKEWDEEQKTEAQKTMKERKTTPINQQKCPTNKDKIKIV